METYNNQNNNLIVNLDFNQNFEQEQSKKLVFNISNDFVLKKLQRYLFNYDNNLDFNVQKIITDSFIRKSIENVDNLKEFLTDENFKEYEKKLEENLSKFRTKSNKASLLFEEIIQCYDILFNLQDEFLNKIDKNGLINLDKEFDELHNQEEDRKASINLDQQFTNLKNWDEQRKKKDSK